MFKKELQRIKKIPQYSRRLAELSDLSFVPDLTARQFELVDQEIYKTQVLYYRKNPQYVDHRSPHTLASYDLRAVRTVWCERVGRFTTAKLLDVLEEISQSSISSKDVVMDKIYAELKNRTDSL